ncbi:MAG: adenine deaminase [Bacteroidales bacterium]|nr:adenine deaminase [Bacteroidales bacterium]
MSGVEGVKFMIKNAENCLLKFFWTVPSCVPATSFETAGASIGVSEVEEMLKWKEIVALGEMMNFPGVINRDPEVIAKCNVAIEYGKKIDGHAPGIRGFELERYASAGISTDHECFCWKRLWKKFRTE